MKNYFLIILIILISISCNENPIFNLDQYYINAFILNKGSNDISLIGILENDKSDNLHEITRFNLHGNKYPTSFYYQLYPGEISFLIVAIAGVETNDDNWGKLVLNNNKQKILFLNPKNGNLEYEIKLNNIPYKVLDYEKNVYVAQSSEYGSFISVFQYNQNKNDFFQIDSIFVGSNLSDFVINYNKNNGIQLLTINSLEKSLNIFDIKTKLLLKKIDLGGVMPIQFSVKNSNIKNNKFCIIDKKGKKIHVINSLNNLIEETINLDYEPSDVNMLFDQFIIILNSNDGNINYYNNEKINWIKYKSFYVGSGINYISYKDSYYPLFALNSDENTFYNFDFNNSLNTKKIKVGNLPLSIIDFR